MMPTKQAQEMLDEVTQKHRDRWMATINTLLIELMAQVEENTYSIGKIHQGFTKLVSLVTGKPVSEIQAKVQPQTQEEESPAPVGRPVESEATHTLGADGAPLAPEEAEREAQMNAAIAASEAEKQGGGAPKKSKKFVPVPVRQNGNGGSPLEKQAAIEAQMDAAIGTEEQR